MTITTNEVVEVIQTTETTRYLGYETGPGQLIKRNWVLCIRKSQRRLLAATKIATSVDNQILILNAIVLFVAIKTHFTMHSITWLTQRPNRHSTAWRKWAYTGKRNRRIGYPHQLRFSPEHYPRNESSPNHRILQEVGEWLAPAPEQVAGIKQRVQYHY